MNGRKQRKEGAIDSIDGVPVQQQPTSSPFLYRSRSNTVTTIDTESTCNSARKGSFDRKSSFDIDLDTSDSEDYDENSGNSGNENSGNRSSAQYSLDMATSSYLGLGGGGEKGEQPWSKRSVVPKVVPATPPQTYRSTFASSTSETEVLARILMDFSGGRVRKGEGGGSGEGVVRGLVESEGE